MSTHKATMVYSNRVIKRDSNPFRSGNPERLPFPGPQTFQFNTLDGDKAMAEYFPGGTWLIWVRE